MFPAADWAPTKAVAQYLSRTAMRNQKSRLLLSQENGEVWIGLPWVAVAACLKASKWV